MKKIIILIAFVIMSNCEITPRSAHATLYKFDKPTVAYETINGMTFAIFSTTNPYGGVHVVNLTKDKLEIQLLKKQLVGE